MWSWEIVRDVKSEVQGKGKFGGEWEPNRAAVHGGFSIRPGENAVCNLHAVRFECGIFRENAWRAYANEEKNAGRGEQAVFQRLAEFRMDSGFKIR